MEDNVKVREKRARRALARQGFTLAKCRDRIDYGQTRFGKYHIVNQNNVVVAGATNDAFDLRLEEVEDYAHGGLARFGIGQVGPLSKEETEEARERWRRRQAHQGGEG